MARDTDGTVPEPVHDEIRTGLDLETLKRAVLDNLLYVQGRLSPGFAMRRDLFMALAYTVRDRMIHRQIHTARAFLEGGGRLVCYLSAEFLPGPQLGANLLRLGIFEEVRRALGEHRLDLPALLDEEAEPGLGSGGLGRLAACYLDSLASLEVPAIGYGIRYEFGIFEQAIRDGWQVELADKWLRHGNPWEMQRPEAVFNVKLGGRTEAFRDEAGRYRVRWVAERVVKGIAYDTPILGYRVNTCNVLRLWKAEAHEDFDFQAFNVGDYYRAVEQKVESESLTKVLYPNDEPLQGRQLRLEQQYFFVSCSLQDMVRMHLVRGQRLETFHETYAVQLNDTHPSIAVAELMRLLVDEHHMGWEQAWEVTRRTFAYTNHTLLPEALEKWPLALFGRVLPRHLEIVYEINRRFLDEVRLRFPGEAARVARMSLIDESGERYVRMANLACVGSHAVNGVAALHTELLRRELLRDFDEMYPGMIGNKTNGVTPRRFLALANPGLARLLDRTLGDGWLTRLEELRRLEPCAEDPAFRAEWRAIKLENKRRLAALVRERTGTALDPEALLDVQVKRIHEYKRQHLNVLHVVTLYHRIKQDPDLDLVPRTFLFGGKAAPGYAMAKLIIKLINAVAEVVDRDPDVRGRLRVAFLPNFNVKNSQWVYPAADLSEQISTAGMEASGTGNMKFAMNGALTIGTLDGANVEIREEVGAENFFLFGLTAAQVEAWRSRGYDPAEAYRRDPELGAAVELIGAGHFSHGDRELFRPLVDSLVRHDPFMLFADYRAYVDCQQAVSDAYRDRERWTRMSILNTARMGKFSSDRAVREYCRDIWRVEPRPVALEPSEDQAPPARAPARPRRASGGGS